MEVEAKKAAVKAKIDAARQAIKLKQANQDKQTAIQKALNRKEEGNKHFACQQYEEAAKCYTDALQLSPEEYSDKIVFLNNRAQAYLLLARFGDAIADCTESLKINPQNVKALMRRGAAYRSLRRREEALADFRQALEQSPDLEEAASSIESMSKESSEGQPSTQEVTVKESVSEAPQAPVPVSVPLPEPSQQPPQQQQKKKKAKTTPPPPPAADASRPRPVSPAVPVSAPAPSPASVHAPTPFPIPQAPVKLEVIADDEGDMDSGGETGLPKASSLPAAVAANMLSPSPSPSASASPSPMASPITADDPAMFVNSDSRAPSGKGIGGGGAGSGTSTMNGGSAPSSSFPVTRIPMPQSSHEIMQLAYGYVTQVKAEMHYFEQHPGELSIERLLQLQRENVELNHVTHVLSTLSVSFNQMLVNLILKVGSVSEGYNYEHVHSEDCLHPHTDSQTNSSDSRGKPSRRDPPNEQTFAPV
mmetsp:Transcript_27105/g.44213  ORF Transcript_27105/g.44213 Transcript_27105/m.44213 type:complete len:476 (-) Transcript_27105:100-1527(-)|eukprot:CAMPEP_0184657132 /NCGR_PEP_ID=MMETSP0308-20130426/17004_1 /TAXON_ID=38269 /ORGANISM="Gloeochaete witrockiana, Strain SAG 46.84" /LENGTH=475 /DNA_ID=CAMNT_0027094561 /DNA_START=40 /DNA_END=1467 /DNA_ORIENTATION=-